ncbi:GTPase IMAP family member 7-like [Echeneis naucrates]|uniref:GTPase IMAP family member 7-like n=1 Tax=Echeneis naucrates TaxID=173247 RepID=A0A665VL96_ECHNA|nr:GTPase IMAP family member 7-like [Echeneis naucrates]
MSHGRRVSVVLLGADLYLKKALIVNIFGKDIKQMSWRIICTETTLFENETFEVVCPPDLCTTSEDIGKILSPRQRPDMCLFVVESGFPVPEVSKQIQNLQMKTGLPREEFIVLLPLNCKQAEFPFRSCSMDQVFRKLRKLVEERHLMKEDFKAAEQPVATPQMTEVQPRPRVNLVLLGMAGVGKSASGNTILQSNVFVSRASSKSVTTECQAAEAEINGAPVRVIDTPDIFDDDFMPSDKDRHVMRCNELCQSDPRVLLLVMQIGRFTDGERDIVKKLDKAFGRKAREQTIILFSCGEELERAGMMFGQFLQTCNPGLRNILEKFHYRCVTFENKSSGSRQVQQLMQMVAVMTRPQMNY